MRSSSLSIFGSKRIEDKKNSSIKVSLKQKNMTSLIVKDNKQKISKTIIELSHHKRSKSYNLNQNQQIPQRKIRKSLNPTPSTKNLKNFIKNQQSSQTYVKQFNYLKKSSFIFNNRLTKSVFDIKDAAMIGKPQGLRQFKTARDYYGMQRQKDVGFGSLKTAVRQITMKKQQQQQTKHKKSLIPQIYQKTFSLANLQQKSTLIKQQKQQLNISLDKSFFPTTTNQPQLSSNTQKFIDISPIKKHNDNNKIKLKKTLSSFTQSIKPTILTKQKSIISTTKDINSTTIIKPTKPSSQRKLRNIDNKLQQLRKHNHSIMKLMPIQVIKPQKVIIKGRGEMISLQKITRVVDKLLSVLELYFQMYDQNGQRVMDYMRNVQGFEDSVKLREMLCCNKTQMQQTNNMNNVSNNKSSGESIKHMESNTQILQYFWAYKSLKAKQTNNNQSQSQLFTLPQFYGEEDYALYKVLNNFCLKLQSKYENTHREKFKKLGLMKVEKQADEFQRLVKGSGIEGLSNIQQQNGRYVHGKSNKNAITQLSFHNNQHLDRKSLLSKIKYHPINSDRKISNQMQQLQDLGVKFDFRQKGKSIILTQKSNILYNIKK